MNTGYESCKVCHKQRPKNAFLAEFNPAGKYYSCRGCIAKGLAYCPIHLVSHRKADVISQKFSFGDRCPVAVSPDKKAAAPNEAPAPSTVNHNPGAGFGKFLEVIGTKLSSLDGISDKVNDLEQKMNTLVPLLSSIVDGMQSIQTQPFSSAEQLALQKQLDDSLESLSKAREAEQLAIAEWEKAEERAKAMEQERDEAKAALDSVLLSRDNVLSIAQELDQFVSRLS